MSQWSGVEWCDSSANPVMGCDGCELWVPEKGIKICYAGTLHEMRGPLVALGKAKGYAKVFPEPEMFAGRMAEAARWSDLRGKKREAKYARPQGSILPVVTRAARPWLDGMPRMIFISDMGDALSKSIPNEYLRDEIVLTVAGDLWQARGHVGMWLTKQPERMAEFAAWIRAQGVQWPERLWAGTSITGRGQGARVRALQRVPAKRRFLSVEPVLTQPGELDLNGIDLVMIGGASGPKCPPTEMDDLMRFIEHVRKFPECRLFVKQLGGDVRDKNTAGFTGNPGDRWDIADFDSIEDSPNGFREEYQGAPVRIRLRDRRGADPTEWPRELRGPHGWGIREYPAV